MPHSGLKIAETFVSIQGESSRQGLPCFFIRTAGCNLNCAYCDTIYARKIGSGINRRITELVDEARSHRISLVEITGGEPLLQENCRELCKCLLDAGFTVMLETNGSLPISKLPEGIIRIMDVKCPGSGEAKSLDSANFADISADDELKFVLSDRRDYDYAQDLVLRHRLFERTPQILYSPVPGCLDPAVLAEWLIADHSPGRLHLQLHKLIWGTDCRGV